MIMALNTLERLKTPIQKIGCLSSSTVPITWLHEPLRLALVLQAGHLDLAVLGDRILLVLLQQWREYRFDLKRIIFGLESSSKLSKFLGRRFL